MRTCTCCEGLIEDERTWRTVDVCVGHINTHAHESERETSCVVAHRSSVCAVPPSVLACHACERVCTLYRAEVTRFCNQNHSVPIKVSINRQRLRQIDASADKMCHMCVHARLCLRRRRTRVGCGPTDTRGPRV